MLEIMLAGGKTGMYFPNSGPGSKTLISGTKNYGFFGEVTEAEMGLNAEFKKLLDNTSATIVTVDVIPNSWFKFIINGRVLFTPKLPLVGKISMRDLYAMKAVFDAKEEFKPATDFTTGQPLYTQNAHVSNGKDLFKVRLMDLLPTAYQDTTKSSFTVTGGNELYMTLRALTIGPTDGDPLGIRKYSSLDLMKLSDGSYHQESWVKEGNGTNSVFTYHMQNVTAYLRTATGTSAAEYAWRPMLELLQDSEKTELFFEPERLVVTNEGLPSEVVVTGAVTPSLSALTAFTSDSVTEPVSVNGFGNTGFVVAPLGGFQTVDNFVPVATAMGSAELALYDISYGTPNDINGHLLVDTTQAMLLFDTLATGDAAYYGYITPSY